MRILSIDFDYFIRTGIETRNNKFPDGCDEVPFNKLKSMWESFYESYPEIKEIDVINEYYICHKKLFNLKKGKVLIADSHKQIARLFPLIGDEHLEVIHIDFHHDNYISGGSKIDCANWVRHLKEMKPDTDITWIRRYDSETASLEGEYPYGSTLDFDFEGEFDYIFLCFSPEWTPPHLRHLFYMLCNTVAHLDYLN